MYLSSFIAYLLSQELILNSHYLVGTTALSISCRLSQKTDVIRLPYYYIPQGRQEQVSIGVRLLKDMQVAPEKVNINTIMSAHPGKVHGLDQWDEKSPRVTSIATLNQCLLLTQPYAQVYNC
jgi:hypothetical protein